MPVWIAYWAMWAPRTVTGRIVTDAGAANGGGSSVVVNVHLAKDNRATQDTTASDRQIAELGGLLAPSR
jgi:hypothetical protein